MTPKEKTVSVALTVQECHTVLAALRRWQNLMEAHEDLQPELSIAKVGGTVPLTPDQVDRLVNRIVKDVP